MTLRPFGAGRSAMLSAINAGKRRPVQLLLSAMHQESMSQTPEAYDSFLECCGTLAAKHPMDCEG